MAGWVCPQIFPLQRPHETQQAEETAENRAFIQQVRGSQLMEDLTSFQEISHKSYLLRISLCYFFFQTFHIFVHAGMCTFQRNIYFGTHNGQWILFQIKWFMWLLLPCIYCNASNSWSKLVHTPVSTCIWWAFDLRSLGLPMQFLSICCMKVLKRENVFIYVLENIWKKIVKSAGYMPNIPAVLKFCHFFSPCLSILDHYLKFC